MDQQTPEQQKMEQIYLRYRKLMLKEAYEILRDPDDAEDAVAQGFVRILQNLSHVDVDQESRLRAYVVRTARNSAIDLWRKHNKERELQLQCCSSFYYEENISIEVRRCLKRLPEKHRQVLLLKHYAGYSSIETARILHASVECVIKTDQRAKKKLAEYCSECRIL